MRVKDPDVSPLSRHGVHCRPFVELARESACGWVGYGLPLREAVPPLHRCTAQISELSNRTRRGGYGAQVRPVCGKGGFGSDCSSLVYDGRETAPVSVTPSLGELSLGIEGYWGFPGP